MVLLTDEQLKEMLTEAAKAGATIALVEAGKIEDAKLDEEIEVRKLAEQHGYDPETLKKRVRERHIPTVGKCPVTIQRRYIQTVLAKSA